MKRYSVSLHLQEEKKHPILSFEEEMEDFAEIGNQVDVCDSENICCPAKVVGITDNSTVKVTFLGWSKKFDSEVTIDKVFPPYSSVRRSKCWAKLSDRCPCYWPSIVYIRQPNKGSKEGREALQLEPKILVIPFGLEKRPKLLKPFKLGVWVDCANIKPLRWNKGEKYTDGSKKSKATQAIFDCAYASMEKSSVPTLDFTFEGGSYVPTSKIVTDTQKEATNTTKKRKLNTSESDGKLRTLAYLKKLHSHYS